MRRSALLIPFLVLASPAAGQDYLRHMDTFRFAAQVVASARSCQSAGFIVSFDAAEEVGRSAIAAAVRDGMPVGTANDLAVGALKDERERLDLLLARVREAPAERKAAETETFIDFWAERCAGLAGDSRSASAVRFPPD